MQFIIDESPDATKWRSGTLLTLSETAQLLELETAELLTRTRSAMVLREQGFSFHIQRQGQARADEIDVDRSLNDPEKENYAAYDPAKEYDAAYSRLMSQLEEVHMALETLEDRLLEICRVEDREMATTDRMKRELATLEKLCRERWQF